MGWTHPTLFPVSEADRSTPQGEFRGDVVRDAPPGGGRGVLDLAGWDMDVRVSALGVEQAGAFGRSLVGRGGPPTS